MFNGEIMFHSAFEKYTWKGCVIESERCDTNYCQVQGWKSFVYVSITKHPFDEGHQILITKTIVLIWKWKAHFIQLHNLVHDFWKKISQGACFFTVVHACTRSLNETSRKCGLVVFIDEHGYILTEGGRGVSKHSWKKIMQLLWTVLKNIKHGIEYDIDST